VADADFHDGHHVMPNGVRVFTTRLIEELRPLLGESGKKYEPAPTGPDARGPGGAGGYFFSITQTLR
jgi:hypothetical protein